MSLQAIDRELRDLEQTLASVAGRVEQLRLEAENQQAELDRLTSEEHQSASMRRQLEKELAEGEARIRNKRMRLNQVRNEKELQALAHEVEVQKEANQRFEAELLALMQASESRTASIAELTPSVEGLLAELSAAAKEIADRVQGKVPQAVQLDAQFEGLTPIQIASDDAVVAKLLGGDVIDVLPD